MNEFYGNAYMINGVVVTPPDEETWADNVIGGSVAGTQRRSPYRTLTWTKRITADSGAEDWAQFDNTELTSLICTPPHSIKRWAEYSDVICLSVRMRKARNAGSQLVATFLVNTG